MQRTIARAPDVRQAIDAELTTGGRAAAPAARASRR